MFPHLQIMLSVRNATQKVVGFIIIYYLNALHLGKKKKKITMIALVVVICPFTLHNGSIDRVLFVGKERGNVHMKGYV